MNSDISSLIKKSSDQLKNKYAHYHKPIKEMPIPPLNPPKPHSWPSSHSWDSSEFKAKYPNISWAMSGNSDYSF